jgi:putative peptide zinc metalloprotease protein
VTGPGVSGRATPRADASDTMPIADRSRIRLHRLRLRPEGSSWVVGRVDTGSFVRLPPIGHRAITLLPHATVGEVRATLREESGPAVDVAKFVSDLIDLGFVAEIDSRPLPTAPVPRPMLPWLRPRHVRWLLHPVVPLIAGSVVFAAAVVIGRDPVLAPHHQDLLWSESGGLILLGNFGIVWSLIVLHELSHLVTARAAGAPGRISLGTRLQFLVAQTDVSGVWAAPRRDRLAVYLAGITTNLVIYAGTVLVRATSVAGPADGLLGAVGLLSLSLVPVQFLVFMRTDIYFVLQDVTGCANLYADGSAYVRHLAGWPLRRFWRAAAPGEDPSRRLMARERLAVRSYAVVLVGGTVACLAVAALISLPVAVTVLTSAIGTMLAGGSAGHLFDAVAVAAISVVFVVLWTRAWWHRHGRRVRRGISRQRRQTGRR